MQTLDELVDALSGNTELRDPLVLKALRRVLREEFVPEHLRRLAYTDRALPLSHEATISQPYVVAFMTTAAQVRPGDRVLEVGTGSGYQAAVLSEMGAEVYTIECVAELAEEAEERLQRLGYRVRVRHGDGRRGWPDAAPFRAILVTAASEDIPPSLVEQLEEGGRLVIPLGSDTQLLKVFVRSPGGLEAEAQVPVRFVPLRHGRSS